MTNILGATSFGQPRPQMTFCPARIEGQFHAEAGRNTGYDDPFRKGDAPLRINAQLVDAASDAALG
jgi:hypothetical protein